MVRTLSPHLQQLIAQAREKEAARKAELAAKQASGQQTASQGSQGSSQAAIQQTATQPTITRPALNNLVTEMTAGNLLTTAKFGSSAASATLTLGNGTKQTIELNADQQAARELALRGSSFCLIGAAGTGKTTTTQVIIQDVQQAAHMQPLEDNTKHLSKGAPAIVICGFTNKAVNNIRKKLPKHLQGHCITIHKLLEYSPVYYEYEDDDGAIRKKMVFEPMRNAANKLPHISTIIFEESSMIGTDLYGQVIAALPNVARTQIIMLGDLNQIPPVFGPSILGFKLAEWKTVELKTVYRQALLSPIISLATAIRTNNAANMGEASIIWKALHGKLTEKVIEDNGEHGKLTIHPWKKRVSNEVAVDFMRHWLPRAIDDGTYDPEQDQILCPFNVSFGTIEINNIIADHLGKKRNAMVWEVIGRIKKNYFAVGDRVLVDRHAAVITEIRSNPTYSGKIPQDPSVNLDRWGYNSDNPQPKPTAHDLFAALDKLETADKSSEPEKNSASHIIKVFIEDTGEEKELTTSGEINNMLFAYALTIHKSQGSEWERVFLFLHNSHSTMCSRELVYTAVTRAKHELYIICEGDNGGKPNQMASSAKRPVIPGVTLQQKIEYFAEEAKKMLSKAESGDLTEVD